MRFSFLALRQNPVRSFLTGLGMVIGTASVILVVTISLTSQNYILDQIEGVGSNMVFASYEIGTQSSSAEVNADFIKIADVQAVREELAGRIIAATGIESNYDSMFINGKEERLLVIGSDEYYKPVRNLVVLSGRFLDASDVDLRQKVALLTRKAGETPLRQSDRRAGPDDQDPRPAVHRDRHVQREGRKLRAVRTQRGNRAHSDYRAAVFPARGAHRSSVRPGALAARCGSGDREVKEILESRHRAGATYKVENLTGDSQRREEYCAGAERWCWCWSPRSRW